MDKPSLVAFVVVGLLVAGTAVAASHKPEPPVETGWPAYGKAEPEEPFLHQASIDALQHLPEGGVLPILVTVATDALVHVRYALDVEAPGDVACSMAGVYGPVDPTFLATLAAGGQPEVGRTFGGRGAGLSASGPWVMVAGETVPTADRIGAQDESDLELALGAGEALVVYLGYDAEGRGTGRATVELAATQPFTAEPWPAAPLACGYGADGMEGATAATMFGFQVGGTATVQARYGTYAAFSSWAPMGSVEELRQGTLTVGGTAIDLVEAMAVEDRVHASSLSTQPARLEIASWDTAPSWMLAGLWVPLWDMPV